MVSLSTIKRLTRTANLYFGTQFSPTQVYRRQKELEAEGQGAVSRDYAFLMNLPKTRADVRGVATQPSRFAALEKGRQALLAQFEGFIEQSTAASVIASARPGDYYLPFGEVVRELATPGADKPTYILIDLKGNRKEIASIPAQAVPFTAKRQYDLLVQLADATRSANKSKPGTGYDAESVFSAIDDAAPRAWN